MIYIDFVHLIDCVNIFIGGNKVKMCMTYYTFASFYNKAGKALLL